MAIKYIEAEQSQNKRSNPIDNYIYLFHTNEWLLLPEYPDQVSDSLKSTFSQTNALSRTAPVFTYSNSGPRTVQVQLNLHRDMLYDLNYKNSNMKISVNEDYVDLLVARIQAIALPKYDATNRGVIPPMVALRLGEEIFVKGVVTSGISIVYQKPIRDDNKYTQVTLNFEVCEIDPYDAVSISRAGSFRGITRTFQKGLYNK